MSVFEFNQSPRITLVFLDILTEYDTIPDLVNIDEFQSFKTEKRRLEHISTRIALAEGLSSWGLDPEQIHVVRDDKRAPSLRWIQGTFRSQELPGISLGHSHGKAVVALIEPGWWVGIDAEPEDRVIASNAFDQFCKGEELEMIRERPEDAVRLWTSKEAVQKAMHLGMHLNPRDITFTNEIPIVGESQEISIGNQKIQLKNMLFQAYHVSVAWKPAETVQLDAEDLLIAKLAERIRDEGGNLNFEVGCKTVRGGI